MNASHSVFRMIQKAFIQSYTATKIEPEFQDVKETLESRGIECVLFTAKQFQRNQIPVDRQNLFVGDNPTMAAVFKKLGIETVNDSYPVSLRKYLKRNVWETTVRKLQTETQYRELPAFFVKPKSRAKLFTGFVVRSGYDLNTLFSIGKSTELYCSDLVEWQSEYRVFVLNTKIVGMKNYSGNPDLLPDMDFVENAIREFQNSEQSTAGYGIDFGVLKNGETALVEWNDGYALGSYGLEKEIYTDLILNRWEELMRSK